MLWVIKATDIRRVNSPFSNTVSGREFYSVLTLGDR